MSIHRKKKCLQHPSEPVKIYRDAQQTLGRTLPANGSGDRFLTIWQRLSVLSTD